MGLLLVICCINCGANIIDIDRAVLLLTLFPFTMIISFMALAQASLCVTNIASTLRKTDLTVAAHTRLLCCVPDPAKTLALAKLTLFSIKAILTCTKCFVLVGVTMDRVV
jgi:hypothetical protein